MENLIVLDAVPLLNEKINIFEGEDFFQHLNTSLLFESCSFTFNGTTKALNVKAEEAVVFKTNEVRIYCYVYPQMYSQLYYSRVVHYLLNVKFKRLIFRWTKSNQKKFIVWVVVFVVLY